jgi:diguanylate cyclase (GGDEF)-like protein/PAS domain S-box-containing protein
MDAMRDFDGPDGRDVPLRNVIDAFMEQARDGVVVADADQRIVMMNERAEELFGYDHRELLGEPVQVVLPGGLPGPHVEAMGPAKDGLLREAEIDVQGRHKAGWQVPVHLSVSYPKAGGGTVAIAFVRLADQAAGDVAAQASAGEATPTAASKGDTEAEPTSSLHDPLTGLPGRVLFTDRLSVALARSDRRTSSVAVLLLDLDRFRLANDSYGRETGDRLLVAVAERLFGSLRPGDTVARVGEDEFAVLCDDIHKREGAANIAERVHAAVVAPYAFDGEEIMVSVTLGFAVASGRDHSPESLYHKAQDALDRAKNHRPGNIEGSDPGAEGPAASAESGAEPTEEGASGTAEASTGEATQTGASKGEAEANPVSQGEAEANPVSQGEAEAARAASATVAVAASPGESLVRALERSEFRLLYQPIIRLHTGRVAGVEALLRWEDPQRGLLSPAEFMADAEDTGLIVQIGTWVLSEAVRDAERLQAASPSGEPLMLSVNLSAKQLAEPAFAQVVRQILAGSRMDPGTLYLEIGESSVMDDAEAASAVLNDLRSTGVRMSIDDVGTGFSSLLHLNRFPIDFLKVDRSFVNLMDTQSGASNIVTAVIAMAHALGLPAIAEGVETEIQLHTLRQLGCDYAQGFLFARPAPLNEVVELLSGDPVW